MSLPAETPMTEKQRTASSPWFSVPKRKSTALTRPNLTLTDNPGGVRAMAAKFETDYSTETSPTKPRSASKTQDLILQFSQESPTKSIRSTRSVSTLGHKRNISISSQDRRSRPSAINTVRDEALDQNLRVSIREEAAMRAVELQQADKGQKPSSQEQPEMLAQRQTIPRRKPVPGGGKEASLENPRSLGTMMPYPEQPPIAQHLNLIRPASSASNTQYGADPSVPQNISTPFQRPGSTTTLHAQIRSLQRQLDLKTEEAVHLRRQLEVQGDADVGTLSQQLREAKREAQTWRERAESAERRIKVFERFTARFKGIREAVGVNTRNADTDTAKYLDGGANGQKENTFFENTMGCESDSSGRTEDAGVIKARIRRCLHGLTDGPPDKPSFGLDEIQNPERPKRDISPSTVEVWMAAQELLQLDEAQGQRETNN